MGKRKASPQIEYWHGGAAGLTAPERLLPLAQVPERHGLLKHRPIRHADVYNPKLLYITVDQDLAQDFAIRYARSLNVPAALYKVKPLGSRVHDIDYPRGISFGCEQGALIIGVFPVTASTPVTGAALKYKTWSDDEPMYDSAGYALPNKLQRHLGVTSSDLHLLGKGANFEQISVFVSELLKRTHPSLTQADVLQLQKNLQS